jgi:hypothetical protein
MAAKLFYLFQFRLLPPVSILFVFLILFSIDARAEVAPAAIRVPETKAWTGQQLPFYVELSARGSFAGAASFALPEIPRTVILKVGNPIVSSQEYDGESWFVQTHEFALFSQQSGSVEVPEFEVRFGSRDSFTGPVKEQQAQVPGARIEIRRPPGSESVGFLVTTESLDLTENWEPQPGPVKVGAIFKRTIVQRAAQMTGMALAAAPTHAPDGVRVYPGQPEVTDKTERGDFLGERRETITYLLQKPGTLELPALTYVWWNPKTEKLQSKTLPDVTFEVTATEETVDTRPDWTSQLAAALLVLGLGIWQRRRVAMLLARCWKKLNPPDRVAARKLLRACRHHDAAAAQAAWNQWHNMQDATFLPGPELRAAVTGMQRCLFGPATAGSWRGDELASAFNVERALFKSSSKGRPSSILPLLNP